MADQTTGCGWGIKVEPGQEIGHIGPTPEPETDREKIERVLRYWIDLSKPDNLAFLEFQVRSIAGDILAELGR